MPQSGSGEADGLAAVLRGRRSIDLFAPEVVDFETVRAAVEVARWAPNHRLTEPWRFYLLGPVALRQAEPSAFPGCVVDRHAERAEVGK